MFLVVDVKTDGTIDDIEKYIPPAKVGNLKDPDKIRQKEIEHFQKSVDEAASNPLLAKVVSAEFALVESPNKVSLSPVLYSKDGSILHQLDKFMSAEKSAWRDAEFVTGVHPTTHMRMLRNEYLRSCVGKDPLLSGSFFCYMHKELNLWDQVQTKSDGGDWRTSVSALGWESEGSFKDSIKLATLLGFC